MSMVDLVKFGPILTGLIISMAVGWTILDEYNTKLVGAGRNTATTDTLFNEGQDALLVFDTSAVFMYATLVITMLVLASQIRSHPVFLIPATILLIVILLVTVIIINVNYELITAPGFLSATNNFTYLVLLNDRLHYIVAGTGVLMMIIMYGKSTREQPIAY